MEKELVKEAHLIEFYPKNSLCFLSKSRVIRISIDEITHVSKYGNETVIYTKGNSYRTFHNLQEILNDLPVNDFFRIHKSHIVALRFMTGMWRSRIVVNDFYLPVTKYYKEQMSKKLAMILDRNYLFIEKMKAKNIS